VAVVVNPDQSLLEELLSSQAFDIVQLHGQESIDLCKQIKPTVEVWKAVTVEFSVETIKNYVEVVDKFVFDLPKNLATQVSQSSRLDFYQQLTALGKPVFLAGGLNTNNIYDLLISFQPWGIDVASGLESSPGKKDQTKIQSFLTEVRRFRQNLENQVWFGSCC
jgi:Phosphoribosylanthranilate isomerase